LKLIILIKEVTLTADHGSNLTF